jgi:hypothetical protein
MSLKGKVVTFFEMVNLDEEGEKVMVTRLGHN